MNKDEWRKAGRRTSCTGTRQTRRNIMKLAPKLYDTENKKIIKKCHDAQRMARLHAKKKRTLKKARTLSNERVPDNSVVSDLRHEKRNVFQDTDSAVSLSSTERLQACLPLANNTIILHPTHRQGKYSQLLAVIEELGRNIKLSYAGSRSSAERLKTGIIQARMLVKDCLIETEIYLRQ